MKSSIAVAAAVVSLSLAVSATSRAHAFGHKGDFTIDAQGGEPLLDPGSSDAVGLTPFVGFDFRNQSDPDHSDGSKSTSYKQTLFYLNPALDYFVSNGFSIGGEILLMHISRSHSVRDPVARTETSYDDPSIDGFGLMPRIGYNVELSRHFSWWIRGGLGYRIFSNSRVPPDSDRSDSFWFLFADAPFLWHAADHFYVGAGPGFSVTLSHRFRQTQSRGAVTSGDLPSLTSFRLLSAVIGGWF